jgi:hypothetical protein
MKNENLIKQLQKFPLDMEVCIFDAKKSSEDGSDEPSSSGIYKSIGVYQVHTKNQLKEIQKEFQEVKNFIALEFNSES